MNTKNQSRITRSQSRKRSCSLSEGLPTKKRNKVSKLNKSVSVRRTTLRSKKTSESDPILDIQKKNREVIELKTKKKKINKKTEVIKHDTSNTSVFNNGYIDFIVPTKLNSPPASIIISDDDSDHNSDNDSDDSNLESIDDDIRHIASRLESFFNSETSSQFDVSEDEELATIEDDASDIVEVITDSDMPERSQSRTSFIEIAIQSPEKVPEIDISSSEKPEVVKSSPVKQKKIELEKEKRVFKFGDVDELMEFLSTCKSNPEQSTDDSVQNKEKLIPEGEKCSKCNNYFVSKYLLQHHSCIKSVSINSTLQLEDMSSKPSTYICKCCSWSFLLEETLVYHYKNAHNIDKSFIDQIVLECQFCNNHFLSKNALQLHLSAVHFYDNNLPSFDDKSVLFKCKTCKEAFKNGSDLSLHATLHVNDSKEKGSKSNSNPESSSADQSDVSVTKFVTCPFCHICYKSEDELYFHGRNEHLSCVICIKEFKDKVSLLRHEKDHNRGRISFVKCMFCKLECKDFKELRKHCLVIHDIRVMPSKCKKYCKKVPTSLNCYICHKEFQNIDDLNIHTRHKHFMCRICFSICSSKQSLNRHEKFHSLYFCPVCSMSFAEDFDLYQHCRKVHKTIIKPHLCQTPKHTGSKEEFTILTNGTSAERFVMSSIPISSTSIPIINTVTTLPMNFIPVNSIPIMSNAIHITGGPMNYVPTTTVSINNCSSSTPCKEQMSQSINTEDGSSGHNKTPLIIQSKVTSSTSSTNPISNKKSMTCLCIYCDMTFKNSNKLHDHITAIHALSLCSYCKEYSQLLDNGCPNCYGKELIIVEEN